MALARPPLAELVIVPLRLPELNWTARTLSVAVHGLAQVIVAPLSATVTRKLVLWLSSSVQLGNALNR